MIGKVFTFNLSLNIPHPIDRTGAIGRIPAPVVIPAPTQWIVGKIEFPILPDVMCPIMHEPIDMSKGVCKCNQCNNIFGYNAFKHWISTNRICPLCRNNNIENKYYTISGEPITAEITIQEPYFLPDIHVI